jgi:hypothetical protein
LLSSSPGAGATLPRAAQNSGARRLARNVFVPDTLRHQRRTGCDFEAGALVEDAAGSVCAITFRVMVSEAVARSGTAGPFLDPPRQ